MCLKSIPGAVQICILFKEYNPVLINCSTISKEKYKVLHQQDVPQVCLEDKQYIVSSLYQQKQRIYTAGCWTGNRTISVKLRPNGQCSIICVLSFLTKQA